MALEQRANSQTEPQPYGWMVLTRVATAVLAAFVASTIVLQPVRADEARPLVLGYYVPYDSTSWTSLEAHADQLDIVSAQWATIDACGGISSRDDQTLKQFAHAHGLRLRGDAQRG